jgi:hypothetical protein
MIEVNSEPGSLALPVIMAEGGTERTDYSFSTGAYCRISCLTPYSPPKSMAAGVLSPAPSR